MTLVLKGIVITSLSGLQETFLKIPYIFATLVLFVIIFSVIKYFFEIYFYFKSAKKFADDNSLMFDKSGKYGGELVFSGKIRRRSIAFSVTRMHVDADTTEAVGYSFEAYKIETDIAIDQQWLIVMDFRHHDEEMIVSPEMPSYSVMFSTSNFEFDKKYFIYADKKPTAKFFQKPEKLKKLAERKLRAAVASGGKLTLYFDRPMVWKYSSFKKIEELIRLCLDLE